MRRPIALLALLAAAIAEASAQAPPSMDIYLARLVLREGRLTSGTVSNLTRRVGYDNQPAFAPDSRTLYFTSNRGDGQTDIWQVDLAPQRRAA